MQLNLEKTITNAYSGGYAGDKGVVQGVKSLGDVAKKFGGELRKENSNQMTSLMMNKLVNVR